MGESTCEARHGVQMRSCSHVILLYFCNPTFMAVYGNKIRRGNEEGSAQRPKLSSVTPLLTTPARLRTTPRLPGLTKHPTLTALTARSTIDPQGKSLKPYPNPSPLLAGRGQVPHTKYAHGGRDPHTEPGHQRQQVCRHWPQLQPQKYATLPTSLIIHTGEYEQSAQNHLSRKANQEPEASTRQPDPPPHPDRPKPAAALRTKKGARAETLIASLLTAPKLGVRMKPAQKHVVPRC